MIIEDENNQAELYERWLSLGYNALVANTRTESYEKLSEDVDVILLDRHLEKNSAKDVLEGNEILAEKTVIILIGVEPDEDVLEMNINGYIMKPVDRGEIKEAVEKGLATKEKNEKVQRLISLLTRKAAIKQKKTKTDP